MHRTRQPVHALAALLATTLGCASLSQGPDACPKSIDEVFGSPPLLREQADAALAEGDSELAYRYLALIETLHPESAESRELFPAAAKLFKRGYFRNRISDPDSVWATSEPAFMFRWLSIFFRDAEEFPQQQVETLFLRMPVSLYDEFVVYARARPKHFARWEMRVMDDNGRITSVTAVPPRRPGGAVSGARPLKACSSAEISAGIASGLQRLRYRRRPSLVWSSTAGAGVCSGSSERA